MIISASRRTDIPAFYSAWLMARIREGYCLVRNPFNANQVGRVSLAPADVDALVFWSKDPSPLLGSLAELVERGFLCTFQFTLNDYPPELESDLPPVARKLETFHELARRLGAERVTWRYDPIVLSPATSAAYHADRFAKLAAALEGASRRVVVSVLDRYKKTERRLGALGDPRFAIDWDAADSAEMLDLMGFIARTAEAAGMQALACAEPRDFGAVGVRPGRCIDGELLASLGARVATGKDPGQRGACGCAPSRDIGATDSCLHGCRYCYATRSDTAARERHARHDPASPILIA